ncbi:AraC family ligand binding domain-containing protein [Blautia sp. RD014234]|nr:AraC family ligand binding domain-containing protein [Blautia parvula]
MYVNTGYLNHAETDPENPQIPLRINSSGIYRVISRPSMSTLRPKGRADYQLIYIASGRAWFTFGQEKIEVGEGNMVLLRPFVRQEYVYYGKDKPEAFWVHFTGYRAEALLDAAGFAQNQILYAGVFPNTGTCFSR